MLKLICSCEKRCLHDLVQGNLGMRLDVLLTIVAQVLCCSYCSQELYWVLWCQQCVKSVLVSFCSQEDLIAQAWAYWHCAVFARPSKDSAPPWSIQCGCHQGYSKFCVAYKFVYLAEKLIFFFEHLVHSKLTVNSSHPWICYDSSPAFCWERGVCISASIAPFCSFSSKKFCDTLLDRSFSTRAWQLSVLS